MERGGSRTQSIDWYTVEGRLTEVVQHFHLYRGSSHQRKGAANHISDSVWLYRSPFPEGRRGVFYLFKWRLPPFAAPRGKGTGESAPCVEGGGGYPPPFTLFFLFLVLPFVPNMIFCCLDQLIDCPQQFVDEFRSVFSMYYATVHILPVILSAPDL